ncbi:hypothetical protein [Xanthomarina sp. GH4-25]|uniref:hypothetical protein n=1 Tax=Xanthomarina sp. GH4-25 TaxID=3349335 RepID=UPI000D67BAE1|nr:dialkylresorcinol condensing enzyme DarA [Flavobacteriaceae bacterium LYZ1037]
MKEILVIHYSQSGQLTEIVNNIVSPLKTEETNLTFLNIEMENPFPFPWNKKEFYGVFPETFLQIPQKTKIVPESILNKKYDLIVFGYAIWYLTPSLPTTSFLNSPDAKKLFANTPVITVIGCRNMWIMAQEKMKRKLKDLQATLVGNIVLADRHINHISVITIAQWMFSGKKERFLGIFPKPGVSQKDIDESVKFGLVIKNHLLTNNYSTLQPELLSQDAVKIKPFLITVDKRANILFSKWAHLIQSKGRKNVSKRQLFVKMFNYYLLFAIWIIAPIVFILFLLTYLPLYGKIKKDKIYYSSVVLK